MKILMLVFLFMAGPAHAGYEGYFKLASCEAMCRADVETNICKLISDERDRRYVIVIQEVLERCEGDFPWNYDGCVRDILEEFL